MAMPEETKLGFCTPKGASKGISVGFFYFYLLPQGPPWPR